MSSQKYIASLLVVVFLVSSFLPGELFASGKQSNNISKSRTIHIPREIQERFKKQKSYLQSKGNPLEYQKVGIQWDVSKQKPSHIRGISKKASKNIVADTKQIMKDFAPSYGVSAGVVTDIRLAKNEISKVTKERHTRLNQFYNNLEIVGGEILAHTDENGILYQIDGTPDVPSISTTPSISKTQALAIGTKEHGTKQKFAITKQPELVLYKRASDYVLAYRYEVSYDDPVDHMGQWMYYIDANTGKKITALNLIHDAEILTSLTGSILAGEGGGVKALTGTFDTSNSTYYMYDFLSASGAYYVFNRSTNTGTYTDANDFAQRTTSAWGTSDPVEMSAGYNLSKTLEYYNALGFGVNNIAFSFTGQTYLPVRVHYGIDYNNAFWSSGDGMYFGDGDGINLKPLVTLDVMAHEFGHAWTENTSNLVYQDEPGALNESFSDISGVNVEMYAQTASNTYPDVTLGQADWLIGEDVMIGEKALRDMRNPANTATVGAGNEQPTKYHGTYWYFGTGDNGGVHYNSSVQNFFYYLLSEGGSGNNDGVLYSVDGIGLENARRIAFEANTHFFTSTTTYKDARQAWIDAAMSIDPNFVDSVKAAWDAVDIAGDPILSIATADESFENGTDLPSGYSSSLLLGTGGLWSVSTSTGALGNNSLVSGVLEDDLTWTGNFDNYQSTFSMNSVSWSGVVDPGYMTFYWRTSSEAAYDTLDFYIDGEWRSSWSGINPWSFYSEAVTSGSHTFTWTYSKDSYGTEGLDQVGIDAVHAVALTGSVSVVSDTATGQYVSATGLAAHIDVAGSYDYIISRSDGQMGRGSAIDTISLPLTGLPDGSGSIDFQYRDSNGFLSPIMTQSFFLDSVEPSMLQITSPSEGMFSGTGNVHLTWDPATDTGAGLATNPYTYYVSDSLFFWDTVASGSTNQLSQDITLSDGVYYAKVEVQDIAGNTSISPIVSFTVDTTSPLDPVNISVNNGNIIRADTQSNVVITGSGEVSESGSTVEYGITDGNISIAGNGVIDANGSFYLSGINVSSLADGMISYNLSIIDLAGNRSGVSSGSIGKSVVPADGTLRFLSGSYTNTSSTDLEISVAKPVSYVLSGSGIANSMTGTIASSGSVVIPVTLSPTDGTKTVQATFTDEAGIETSTITSIVFDTTAPILSIHSYNDGAQVVGSTVIMTGSISDVGGIATATLNAAPLSSVSNWSQSVNLVGGDNVMVLSATDNAGNSNSLTIHIDRIIVISNIVSSPIPTGAQIDFETDMTATGVISYGTDSGNLNLTQDATSADGLHQSITLVGLAPNTVYYYTLHGASATLSSQVSDIQSFVTPNIIDVTIPASDIYTTGSVVFSGVVATGSTVFNGTGIISIGDTTNATDRVSLNSSGLVITTTGTGVWDGMMLPPRAVALSGITLSGNGYAQTGAIFKAGNDSVGLSLSGQTASLQVYLGTAFNGRILRVYRSDTGGVFDPIDVCTVSSGVCQFATNHFSFFAFGAPNDTTPDAFTFTDKTSVELSTSTDSDQITVSGINTAASISVSGGMYSVNNTSYTANAGTVSNGDTIKVRLTSSASYNTTTQMTLTIGGVSSVFRVTTKAAPVVVSSGGGGGGGGGPRLDNCPNGDTSPSYYDGICEKVSTQNTSALSSITPQKTSAARSGFLSNNAIVAGYDFTANKRIPQKVAAELNFFITKLMKILDVKAGQNEAKKKQYYQAVNIYIANRAQQTSDAREKRIMEYLRTRLVVATKGIIVQEKSVSTTTAKVIHKNIPSKIHK